MATNGCRDLAKRRQVWREGRRGKGRGRGGEEEGMEGREGEGNGRKGEERGMERKAGECRLMGDTPIQRAK